MTRANPRTLQDVPGPVAATWGRSKQLAHRALSERSDQFQHSGEQISVQHRLGHAEDRRLTVPLDRKDLLGVLHACQVLDRKRDNGRHTQL